MRIRFIRTVRTERFCKELGIRMTGKPLGRPPVETEENREKLMAERKQRYRDDVDRIAVEGCIGVAKRKYGLGLIKSKLRSTSETEICPLCLCHESGQNLFS